MKNELTLRPTPLEKCLLCMTLPLTQEKFFDELHESNPKDFAKTYKREVPVLSDQFCWERHEKLINYFDRVQHEVKDSGINVITDFSLSHMKCINNYDVVTIIGHWLEESQKIELADGVYSIDDFINAIPMGTECMLDLTVCHSSILLKKIKNRFRKKIIVFGFSKRIITQYWLLIYLTVIREMNRNKSLNYLGASASVRKNWILGG
jgi:hypothetical protein